MSSRVSNCRTSRPSLSWSRSCGWRYEYWRLRWRYRKLIISPDESLLESWYRFARCKTGLNMAACTESCVQIQFWTKHSLCIILDSFVLGITYLFSGRFMAGWSHSIKQVLRKVQQVEIVMLANYEQVYSLSQEPISKTWIFEMPFFDRNFLCFQV